MKEIKINISLVCLSMCCLIWGSGCTVKAVGDPNRPITIEAHVTVDIRGLENTATNIEDYVSGKKDQNEIIAK